MSLIPGQVNPKIITVVFAVYLITLVTIVLILQMMHVFKVQLHVIGYGFYGNDTTVYIMVQL
jgi:hypothetical protein